MPIRWRVYPASQRPGPLVEQIAEVFRAQQSLIGTPPNKPRSDTVLAAVSEGLQALGFEVETSKQAKIRVPVLYGENGMPLKTFEVDAWHPGAKAIIEVEAGIAVDARKIYQDLFEAMALPDVDFCCIAVQNAYHPARKTSAIDDFSRSDRILETLFASNRIALPLATVMLIGY